MRDLKSCVSNTFEDDLSEPMINNFDWTTHATERLRQRDLDRGELERIVRVGHPDRTVNRGRAEWRVTGQQADGTAVVVIYDHPAGGDPSRVRVVSAWVPRDFHRGAESM
jgi:hypothetical protein